MEMLNKATSTYTVEGLEMVNGHECLKIVSKSKGSVEGGGSTMGQNMNTEGDTESERVIYFDFRKGFVVKYTFNSFMEGTVAVSGQANMTIPMVNETKISMQLIK